MAGTITALRFQKRNKDRVNVYLDGQFAFGLTAIEAVRLRVGQMLSDDDVARLQVQDEVERAYERALYFLSYRPRSEAEVRRNLRKKNVEDRVAEVVVERLTRTGLLDDQEFARYWVESRLQFNRRLACLEGRDFRRRLGAYLARRGFPYAMIGPLVEEMLEGACCEAISDIESEEKR